MLKNKKWLVLAMLVLATLVVSACAAPAPEQVVVTIEVEGEGGETIIVTATPEPGTGIPERPLMADGMVACNPLPEMAISRSVGVAAPSAPAAPMAIVREAPAAPAQQAGDVYRVGVFEDVTTRNFFAANGPDNTVWNAYVLPPYLSLYGLADRTFQFIPSVALDLPAPLTQEGDFWVVEIPMRDDIFWSDGTPFTAADVAFTADTAKKLGLFAGNWTNWYDFSYLDHIEAVDDYTVKIVYHTKPGLARHEYGVLGAPIMSAAYWGAKFEEFGVMAPIDALGENPDPEALTGAQAEAQDILYSIVPDGEPVAGAWVFASQEPGAFFENSSNATYFARGTTVTQYVDGTYQEVELSGATFTAYGEGASDVEVEYTVGPNVVAVVYTVYGSQDAALLALRAGEVDFVLNPLGLQRGLLEQVQDDPNLAVLENQTNGFRYLSFNNRRQPMNDCAFRQAVAVLIDKEFVTGTILQGIAFPLYTFVPEGNAAWYFEDVPKLGQGLTREERINLAIAIMEQAGFGWTGDQKPVWDADNRQVLAGGRMLLPDGTPFPELDLWAPSAGYDPLRSTFAIWIETWLREFGIPVTANLAGFNVLVPRIFTEQDFDMYILGWSLSIFPDFLYDFFATEQAAQDGNNAGGYINPEFDAAGKALLECDSVAACKAIADELQIILSTEVPYVVLFDTGIMEAYNRTAVEYPFTETLSGLQYNHQGGSGQANVRVIR